MSIDDETVKLVELVRKQPALWNTKLKVFKDNNKKSAIWTEIASQLASTSKILKIIIFLVIIII